jgi:hypothetical protein
MHFLKEKYIKGNDTGIKKYVDPFPSLKRCVELWGATWVVLNSRSLGDMIV